MRFKQISNRKRRISNKKAKKFSFKHSFYPLFTNFTPC